MVVSESGGERVGLDGSVRRLQRDERPWCCQCANAGRSAPSILAVMGEPDQCPACESVQLERRGGKDFCPRCHYIQPCCDGGLCT